MVTLYIAIAKNLMKNLLVHTNFK